MNFKEIFIDTIKYPFSNIAMFIIIGIIAVLADLTSFLTTNGSTNMAILTVSFIITLIAMFYINGYRLSVIREGIVSSGEVPSLDPRIDFIEGVKSTLIEIAYFIIPIVVILIFAFISGAAISINANSVFALGPLFIIVGVVLFILFALFGETALLMFADTGDFWGSLSISDVWNELEKIGILRFLVFLIVLVIILFIILIIFSLISFIPVVGELIATFLISGFSVLYTYYVLGLFYGGA